MTPVPAPSLPSWVAVVHALPLGPGGRVFRTPHVTYVLEEDALHILFEPGDRPGRTGIRDATEVEVYAPFPPEIHAVLWPQCSSRRLSRPVAGYVRVAGGYLPLGRLVQRGAAYLGTTLYRMTYQLETPISFRVLDRVRAAPVDQPCPGAEWLRHLPHDPVSALRGFVTEWYADLAPPLGPLSSAVMPTPLAVAYEVIAGATSSDRMACSRHMNSSRITPDGWFFSVMRIRAASGC